MKRFHFALLPYVIFAGTMPIAQGITVTNALDSGPGSLREALAVSPNDEVVDFAPSLNGVVIILISGPLVISERAIIIDASMLPLGVVVSGNSTSSVLSISDSAAVTLRNLHLRSGRAIGGSGGGVHAVGSHVVMDGCTVEDCFATHNGGGMSCSNVTGSISRCRFAGNESSSFGGGIFMLGASPEIVCTEVSGNKSDKGGGIANLSASPTLRNCSIQGNLGGGIRNDFESDPILRNCIVWGNGGVGNSTASRQVLNLNSSHPDAGYCLIQGASGSASFSDGNSLVWSVGNLNGTNASQLPAFVVEVDAATAPSKLADLRLYQSSSAQDAGSNSSVTTSWDLAGKVRVQGGVVDLGAYEGGYVSFAKLHPALLAGGDANGNGYTNFFEYSLGLDPGGTAGIHDSFITKVGDFHLLTTVGRVNGVDIISEWETSTSLGSASWRRMEVGVDYTLDHTLPLSPGVEQSVLRLLGAGNTRFFRRHVSSRY
jgi:hypothetical protein